MNQVTPIDAVNIIALETVPAQKTMQTAPDRVSAAGSPAVTLRGGGGGNLGLPAHPSADVISRPGQRRLGRQRLLFGAAAILAAAALGVGGYRWWEANRFLVSTDDAYLQSDSVVVSPQVAGTIAELDVTDNQRVQAGQVLARIDDRPFRAALAKADADVASAEAKLTNIGAEIAEQVANVASSRAVIAADKAAVGFAQADATRYARLSRTGFGTVQTAERAAAELSESQAKLTGDRAVLTAAERQIGVLASERQMAEAALQGAEAEQQTAKLNLSYTVITAPFDGVVGDRGVRLGAYVSPGTPLLQVVPMGSQIYLTANFKETQIGRMKPGQKVTLSVDTFPGHEFHGTVESLSPGSGSQFALLPPENATGNFTKIVQRVPVKIALSADDPMVNALRPGLSVEATVNTAPPAADEKLALGGERVQ
ncbi:MAG TPA: HlyD family secretion protein [Acetobacteraceae bacterium]|nr:HlyD family secretion protein [Acetobacteraceae bacterium]